jgi:hypothetical protein
MPVSRPLVSPPTSVRRSIPAWPTADVRGSVKQPSSRIMSVCFQQLRVPEVLRMVAVPEHSCMMHRQRRLAYRVTNENATEVFTVADIRLW